MHRHRQGDRLSVALVAFGFTEYTVKLAEGLAKDVAVSLFLPDSASGGLRAALPPEVEIVPFHKPRLRQPIRQVRMCHGLVRELENRTPDIIHLQQGHMWFNLAMRKLNDYPFVVTIHDHTWHPGDRSSQKSPQWIFNMGFRRASHVIVHAESLRKEVLDLNRVRSNVPIDVIPIPEVIAPPSTLPASEESNLVLFFGRIWAYKGLEHLIRAEPLISAEVPGARIAIAGLGEDLDRYRKLMTDPDRYEIHNEYVSPEMRDELFARASVVVLPYVEASQSAVIPIAYAFAKPVVATQVGGLPEAVDDGQTGLLVPARDERALANAIVQLLRDDDRRRELGQAGCRKLVKEFSAEAVGARTASVYEAVARKNRTTRL